MSTLARRKQSQKAPLPDASDATAESDIGEEAAAVESIGRDRADAVVNAGTSEAALVEGKIPSGDVTRNRDAREAAILKGVGGNAADAGGDRVAAEQTARKYKQRGLAFVRQHAIETAESRV